MHDHHDHDHEAHHDHADHTHDHAHSHPHEHVDKSLHTAPAVLDIGDDVGALIIYTPPVWHGREIEVSPIGDDAHRTHTAVLEREANGRHIFAALYLALPVGDYTIWSGDSALQNAVTITGGMVAEVDWRQK